MENFSSELRTRSLMKTSTTQKPEGEGEETTSSITTIFSVVNIMIGGLVLLMPVNFYNSGIIFSLVAMVVICIISWKTLSWVIIVSRGKPNISETIRKYIGKTEQKVFIISCFCLCFGAGAVYFSLLNTTLFKMLEFIFAYSNFTNYSKKSEISFTKISIQWQGILLYILMYPLLFFKELKFLVELGKIGAYAIYAYIVCIIYLFFENLQNDTIEENIQDLELYTPNIAYMLGNFALAFCIHDCIAELMSTNKHQEKNVRDSKYIYGISALMYAMIGIFGAFVLLGKKTSIKNPQDIFDYFVDDNKNIPMFIIALVFFVHLITVYPILCYLCKSFLATLTKDGELSKMADFIHNSLYHTVGLIVVIINFDPNIVVGFIGTIFGFILVYFIPIRLRMCQKEILDIDYQTQKQEDQDSYFHSTVYEDEEQIQQHNIQQKLVDDNDNNNSNNQDISNFKIKPFSQQLNQLGLKYKISFILLIVLGLILASTQFLEIFGVA